MIGAKFGEIIGNERLNLIDEISKLLEE